MLTIIIFTPTLTLTTSPEKACNANKHFLITIKRNAQASAETKTASQTQSVKILEEPYYENHHASVHCSNRPIFIN